MRLYHIVIFFTFIAGQDLFAQQPDRPTDYLSPAFHAGRREALRKIMPENSVTVVWAYPTRNFSNDVDYYYHPGPDLYYFTGYKEPHALLFIFKDTQTAADGSRYLDLFFVQKRDAKAEQWTGRRLGAEGVKKQLGLETVFNGDEFREYPLDFSSFDQLIFDQLPDDVSDSRFNNADLYSLLQQLKQKAAIPENYSRNKRFNTRSLYRQLTATLRGVKTEEEIILLRKAVEISCVGQTEVMKAAHPGMSEREIQGLHEFVHKKYGAENVGYPSIVGAGNNGCVLHYQENEKLYTGNQLLLMDVGAEYHGYTADVTRTIPANGRFSPEQKAIYQIVYEAQEAAFRLSREGASFQELEKAARDVVTNGLLKLGIVSKKEDAAKYYPHGLGHHIGLDVHDRGLYTNLQKGMVITIEPGIYIPENSPCDKKWWSIAVRIEDDILIREKDYELLSALAPRKIEDIEKMMARKSALDDFVLPPLQSGKKGF